MRASLALMLCWWSVTVLAADSPAAPAPPRPSGRVYRDQVQPQWIDNGKSLWYRVQTGPDAHEFVLIDVATGERKIAKSLADLKLPPPSPVKTSTLKLTQRRTRRTGAESGLKLINKLAEDVTLTWINPQGERVPYGSIAAGQVHEQHTFAGHVWLISKASGALVAIVEAGATTQTIEVDGEGIAGTTEGASPRQRGERSPDGKWEAFVQDGVVKLRDIESKATRELKTDLNSQTPYRGRVTWSPDSKAFVVSNAAEVPPRKITIVDSSPASQQQPLLKEVNYRKPGDPLPNPKLVLFRLDGEKHTHQVLSADLFPNPFRESYSIDVTWADDSSEFYFDYNQRGHQLYRVLAADAQTGAVRVVVEEQSPTFIDYTRKTWRRWLLKSGELLWMSERDGWCHLWLYDVKTGEVKNRVTQGAWPVREVLHVDEEQRTVWFLASGLRAGEDPYHLHLCRANFDGSDFRQLTEADGTHRVEFSPDWEHFVATWSRVDHLPVHELRRSQDGSLTCVLERADATDLYASDWAVPERFVAKGRDGQTDIYGIIIKPANFDPAKKYPVVEEIYAGPHGAFVPKEFHRLPRQHGMADLGFIIVQIDGMGTNHRGKAFHDVCWKNLADAGFPDRIAWMKAAAKDRPWMDLSRVGIYGGSAGGQSAMRALLDHHDFYHVAVADCGCHDNRMDKIWWNEQWMGWPVDDSYAKSSNAVDAHKLQGKLLLIVGELDDNVDPASTTQVVAALQRADKEFDFMPIIGAGHGAAETPYGSRLRREFLVRHLLGQ